MDHDLVARAWALADEVLWPRSLDTDRSGVVPVDLLDALAGIGLYGLQGPVAAGGLDADEVTKSRVMLALSSGCLTTTFVWMQHGLLVGMLSAFRPDDPALADACAGRLRAGAAFSHLRRPDPPPVTLVRTDAGWLLHGRVSWVSGWDRIEAVCVGVKHDADVVWLRVPARIGDGLSIERLDLAAVDATNTVSMTFDGYAVDDVDVLGAFPFSFWSERNAIGNAVMVPIALGLAHRAGRLLESDAVLTRVDTLLEELDAGPDLDRIPGMRADAAQLALAATATLVTAGGGGAIERTSQAQRLAREALFVTVQAQTREMRAALTASLLATTT